MRSLNAADRVQESGGNVMRYTHIVCSKWAMKHMCVASASRLLVSLSSEGGSKGQRVSSPGSSHARVDLQVREEHVSSAEN